MFAHPWAILTSPNLFDRFYAGDKAERLIDPDHDVARLNDRTVMPFASFNSSAAALVIDAVRVVPPTLMRTWAVVWPPVDLGDGSLELIARADLH